jgi:hypothetical protein
MSKRRLLRDAYDVSKDFNRLVGIQHNGQVAAHNERQNKSWGPFDTELNRLKHQGISEVWLNSVFDTIPKWVKDSVVEQYPEKFFDNSHDTFIASTGLSLKRSSEILFSDKDSHKHDISEISKLITTLIEVKN